MINIKTYCWFVDLDGTMNDDRDRLKKYRGDPGSSESWTQYHDHWGEDFISQDMIHLVNLIPETDWLFFVSLRHQKHWHDTREELEAHLRRERFGVFLYEGRVPKQEAWRDNVAHMESMLKRTFRENKYIRHGGTFLVDDSDWRLSALRDSEWFWDVVHLKVALASREDV